MTVGARPRLGLTEVDRKDLNSMVDQTTGRAMVVTGEVASMAADALTTTCNCRGLQGTVGSGVVAGCTAIGRMDLSHTDKW